MPRTEKCYNVSNALEDFGGFAAGHYPVRKGEEGSSAALRKMANRFDQSQKNDPLEAASKI